MTSLKYTLAEKSHIIIYPVSVVILLFLLTLSYPNFATECRSATADFTVAI